MIIPVGVVYRLKKSYEGRGNTPYCNRNREIGMLLHFTFLPLRLKKTCHRFGHSWTKVAFSCFHSTQFGLKTYCMLGGCAKRCNPVLPTTPVPVGTSPKCIKMLDEPRINGLLSSDDVAMLRRLCSLFTEEGYNQITVCRLKLRLLVFPSAEQIFPSP